MPNYISQSSQRQAGDRAGLATESSLASRRSVARMVLLDRSVTNPHNVHPSVHALAATERPHLVPEETEQDKQQACRGTRTTSPRMLRHGWNRRDRLFPVYLGSERSRIQIRGTKNTIYDLSNADEYSASLSSHRYSGTAQGRTALWEG